VNILLDECVDRRLARDLAGHSVSTVPRCGWAGIKNGDLLRLAEKEFDAFITVDRKLSIQQDLTQFKIAVLLIRAGTNRLEDIRPLVPELLRKLPDARAGTLTVVESERPVFG
jgi:predicted nuclease of predicted toxin-antitoxin system